MGILGIQKLRGLANILVHRDEPSHSVNCEACERPFFIFFNVYLFIYYYYFDDDDDEE